MANEIIKSNQQDIQAVSMVEGYVNTLPIETVEGKIATVNAYNAAVSLKDFVGVVLHVCDVITMPGVRKSRIVGQPDMECQNTYLIDVDGKAYFSQSDGVARSINVIAAMMPDFGKGSELGYLPLACTETQLANGNTLKQIVIVSDAKTE